jgi:hypothetical protein
LAVVLAIVKGIQTASTVILSQGDITTIIVVEAIANALLMGVSYYKESQ